MMFTQLKENPAWICVFLIPLFFLACGTDKKSKQKPESETIASNPPKQQMFRTFPGNRELPYKLDQTYEYAYYENSVRIGTVSFKIDQMDDGNYKIFSKIDLKNDTSGSLTNGESTLILDPEWHFINYTREMYSEFGLDKKLNGDYYARAEYADGIITVELKNPPDNKPVITPIKTSISDVSKGAESPDKTRSIPDSSDEIFIFDNNFIGLMAYICSQPILKTGRREHMSVFMVMYTDTVNLLMTPIIRQEIDHAGEKIVVYNVDMKSDDATFGNYFISSDGVLVKAQEQGGFIVIELLNPLS
jgi:hypothetical protein